MNNKRKKQLTYIYFILITKKYMTMIYNIHKAHNNIYNYNYIISKNIVRR